MYKPDIFDKIMDFSGLDLWHFLAGLSEVNIVPIEKMMRWADRVRIIQELEVRGYKNVLKEGQVDFAKRWILGGGKKLLGKSLKSWPWNEVWFVVSEAVTAGTAQAVPVSWVVV